MTRLESGAVTLNKEPQFLEEVVGAVLNRFEGKLHDRPVEVRIPEDLPMIPMDGLLMEQAFINLVENALKHTQPGSPVTISARALSGEVQIEVADQGPGLPPGEQARIFDMFYRGQADRTTRGYGLGLSICRAIVQAHGGTIEARNRAGGGAVFRITLPLGASALPGGAQCPRLTPPSFSS